MTLWLPLLTSNEEGSSHLSMEINRSRGGALFLPLFFAWGMEEGDGETDFEKRESGNGK